MSVDQVSLNSLIITHVRSERLRRKTSIVGTHCYPSNGYSNCTSCKACDYGHHQSGETFLDYCTACGHGEFANVSGQVEDCAECQAGTFAVDENGTGVDEAAVKCDACEAGRYSFSDRSTICQVCGAGHYSSEGSRECFDCLRGKFFLSFFFPLHTHTHTHTLI